MMIIDERNKIRTDVKRRNGKKEMKGKNEGEKRKKVKMKVNRMEM